MASSDISDKVRKLIWASSGSLCALCQTPLAEQYDEHHHTVLGEEAHICSSKVNGPRYDPRYPAELLHQPCNLMVLCSPDHKRIDDHPDIWPAVLLRERKSNHEKWVESTLIAQIRDHPNASRNLVFGDYVPTVRSQPLKAQTVSERNLLREFISNPSMLSSLSPQVFEELVAAAMKASGYEVQLAMATGEGGVDVIAKWESNFGPILYAVKCKRYASDRPVTAGEVRSFIKDLNDSKMNAGLILTTSYFTTEARRAADPLRGRVSLRDADSLREWLTKFAKDDLTEN